MTTSALIFCLLLQQTTIPVTSKKSSISEGSWSLTCSEQSMDACPPGFFCKEGHCECLSMSPNDIVRCNATRDLLDLYYCGIYNEEKELICCMRKSFIGDTLYLANATNNTCKQNKMGVMCGRCLPDHYPLAYSYNMNCVLCPNARMNWLWYIMAAFLPLTVFYIVILYFSINATSGQLFPLVFYCQTATLPITLRLAITESWFNVYTKLLISAAGISNLDFFRPFYSNLCLGIGILPTLALDYVIAVYPLLLIAITYLLINLHDRDYRVITFIIRPFKAILSLVKRSWNLKTSTIDAFASFFLFSNVKFLSVSYDFLCPKIDHHNHTIGLYYAGDIPYFGKEHLPYAILAIVMLCVFVLFPVAILALYPFSFFHKFINMLPGRWHVLHTFMDVFYCDYKDGTQPGTRDYRWWASTFYLLRMGEFLLYSFLSDVAMLNLLASVSLIMYTTCIAVLRPYKASSLNGVYVLFLQILAAAPILVSATMIADENDGRQYFSAFKVLKLLSFTAIPLYYAGFACYWVYKNRSFILCWRRGYSQLAESSISFPDRIENSREYRRQSLGQL